MTTAGRPAGSIGGMEKTSSANPDPRRWLILGTVGLAQLMVVLDVTIVNIALPSAQRSLGFTAASAAGGAATGFGMLVAARAAQGAFGALLAPAALSILTTTFSDPKERGKAFGVYGAIVGAGGAIGLVLGGVLTEYLTWRWCLYVNLLFAGLAVTGAVSLLKHQRARTRPRLDL